MKKKSLIIFAAINLLLLFAAIFCMAKTCKNNERMMTSERRQKIIEILSLRRFEKIDNLAFELNVTRRTIEKDLYRLSFDYPIYTIQGRNGGVQVMKDAKLTIFRLNEEETALLQRVLLSLEGRDYSILQGIIKKYGKPIKK